MSTAFIAGLGGLRTHQGWLDVIGNNLANSNTPGFKSARASFADLLSRTLRAGTPPTGSVGGVNPSQIGLGVELSHVSRHFGQGALNLTGRTFDLALVGQGFFALDSTDRTVYTRVGSFGLDSDSALVDEGSGYRVLGADGQPITIDVDAVVAPSATTELEFGGNLPAEITGPLAQVLTSASSFVAGTPAQQSGTASTLSIPTGETWTMEIQVNGGAPQVIAITGGASTTVQDVVDEINATANDVTASLGGGGELVLTGIKNGLASTIKINPGDTGQDLASALGLPLNLVTGTEFPASGTTTLNELTTLGEPYLPGDTINVSGTDADGTPVLATFEYGTDGTTIDDLVSFLSSQFNGATASFNQTTGQLNLTADVSGEAELSLVISDTDGQAGASDWAVNAMATTTNGTGPDTVTTSVEVWDSAGVPHIVSLVYERQDDGSWNLSASIDDTEGTVLNGDVTGITFSSSGALLTPPTASISVQFDGQPQQDITLALGTAGAYDGLTQFGSPHSVKVLSQNGFGSGTLATLQVTNEGVVQGFFTNGEIQDLAQIGVATFANEQALEDLGNNFWGETANSGLVQLSAGLFDGAGEVIGGALEQSNVDTTEQFVALIQAQRGFQASARVITTQDQILEEVSSIV